MTEGKFEKVTQTDTPLYGPRKLLLAGFGKSAQPKFLTVLKMAGLTGLPVVWVGEKDKDQKISSLLAQEDDTGFGMGSSLHRAIIVSGILEKELHLLMNICKKTGMKKTLWAVVTPTSESWTLESLLKELERERKAMSRKR